MSGQDLAISSQEERVQAAEWHRREKLFYFILVVPALILLIIALAIPVGIVLRNSFFPADANGFSLANFGKFLSDEYFLTVLWRTFNASLIGTLLTIIPGYVVAYNIAFHPSKWWRTAVMAVTLVPLAVNLVIRVFGWMTILSLNGTLNRVLLHLNLIDVPLRIQDSLSAVLIGFVHSHLYFMVLPLAAILMKIDPSLLRAAESMGARPFQTFLRVILPISLPGFVSGSLLVFALNVSDFVAPTLLGGNKNKMMTYLIYEHQLFLANDSFAAAATVLLLIAVCVAVIGALKGAEAFSARRFG